MKNPIVFDVGANEGNYARLVRAYSKDAVIYCFEPHPATFKKLVIEGEKSYLRALNPAWPEPIVAINGNATICGVVIFKGEQI